MISLSLLLIQRTVVGLFVLSPLATGHLAAADLVLSSPRLEVTLSTETGDIVGIKGDGQPLVERVGNVYESIRREGKDLYTSADDKVRHQEQPDPQSLVFTVTNSGLPGVTLKKKYRIAEGGSRVVIETEVAFEETHPSFLAFSSDVALSADFRKGGFYSDPARHPKSDTRIAAETIKKSGNPRIEGVADWHRVIFTDQSFGRSLLHERTQINGRAVTPITNHNYQKTLVYHPKGWSLGLEAWAVEKGKGGSVQSVLQLVDGDQAQAWVAARGLPHYKELHAHTPPSWVKEVKYFHSIGYGSDDESGKWLEHILKTTEDGYILVLISDVWGEEALGMYPTQGEWMGRNRKASGASIRALVDRYHAMSPRIKVSVYTWWWGFSNKGEFGRLHPEWLVRDAKGDVRYTQVGPNLESTYAVHLTPSLKKHILARTSAIVNEFDLDVLYLDGGQGGVADFDWSSHSKASDADWMDLYQEMLATIRKSGKDKAFWTNGTTGLYAAYTDCGYFEGFSDPEDWRGLSERLMQVKTFQDTGKWTAPLYLHPTNAKRYLGYLFLLGLHPPAYSSGHYSAKKVATQVAPIELMDELKEAKFLPGADFSPKWWRGKGEEEVYLHELGGNLLLTAMTHAKKEVETTVRVSTAAMASLENKELFVWSWNLTDLGFCDDIRDGSGTTRSQELYEKYQLAPRQLMATRLLETRGADTGEVEVSLRLKPQQPDAIYISATPAVVVSEEGNPLQTWQSGTGATRLTGSVDHEKRETHLSVASQKANEVLVVTPARAVNVLKAGGDGAALPFTYRAGVAPAGWSAVVVALPKGTHQLRIVGSPEKTAAQPGEVAARLEQKDGVLQVFVDRPLEQTVSIAILRDDVPVAWRQVAPQSGGKALLSIPGDLLEPGSYRAILEGPTLATVASNPVAVKSSLPKLVSGLVYQEDTSVSQSGNLTVLGSWQQTVGHSDFNFATADREKLYLDVGLGARLYGYGYAGFDLKKADSLLVRVKLTPPDRDVFYHFRHNAFLGLTVDFHTPEGWKRRAWIALGVQAQRTSANAQPFWGTHSPNAAPGQDSRYTDLTGDFKLGAEHPLWIDVKSYAPQGWDGRVIVGAVDRVAGKGTRLECTIEAADVPYPGAGCLVARQDEDLIQTIAAQGWEIQPSPRTVRELDIEATLYGKDFDHAETIVKTGKIVITGPNQAAGYLTTNARLPTLKVTRNSGAKGAWIVADYHRKGEGFSHRVLFPLGEPGADCTLAPLGKLAGEVIKTEPIANFTGWVQLDFIKHAPEGWSGPVVVWLVSGDLTNSGRLAAEFVENVDSYRY